MYVVVAAVISAGLLGFVGMLVYASPNPTDRLAGSMMMAAAAATLVMTVFHRNPFVAVILRIVVVVTLLGTAWLLARMFRFF